MREKKQSTRAVLAILAVLVAGVSMSVPVPAEEQQPSFENWLQGLRAEAAGAGISGATLDAALEGVVPIPRVIELDRSQPEFTWTLDDYLRRVVSKARIAKGRSKLAENRSLVAEIGRHYGVQPRFLVAFWGIETDFGRLEGGFPVVGALATLAYDGRRSAYFRRELLNALHILDGGHIGVDGMVGSWAGAMGQPQFMPSSFRRFAVDYDGDGRRDIWNSKADVFASAANYLSSSGWVSGQRWGREVRLTPELDRAWVGLEHRKRLSEWQAVGVRRANGADLPKRPDLWSSVVQPDGEGGRAFVVYENYRTILKWNRSHLFGIAVGTLADQIGGL